MAIAVHPLRDHEGSILAIYFRMFSYVIILRMGFLHKLDVAVYAASFSSYSQCHGVTSYLLAVSASMVHSISLLFSAEVITFG